MSSDEEPKTLQNDQQETLTSTNNDAVNSEPSNKQG